MAVTSILEWVVIRCFETSRLKSREPSIVADMKAAKIMPNRRSVASTGWSEEWARGWVSECAACNVGVQRKTNRYIAPSKKQEVSPRESMRLSFIADLRAFDVGGIEVSIGLSWVAP